MTCSSAVFGRASLKRPPPTSRQLLGSVYAPGPGDALGWESTVLMPFIMSVLPLLRRSRFRPRHFVLGERNQASGELPPWPDCFLAVRRREERKWGCAPPWGEEEEAFIGPAQLVERKHRGSGGQLSWCAAQGIDGERISGRGNLISDRTSCFCSPHYAPCSAPRRSRPSPSFKTRCPTAFATLGAFTV